MYQYCKLECVLSNYDRANKFLLAWIDGIEDSNEGSNLELQRWLGVFDYVPVPLSEIAADRNEDLQKLQLIIDNYRTREILGITPQDVDWKMFDEALSGSDREQLLERLETDDEGLGAAFSFLAGDSVVSVTPYRSLESEDVVRNRNSLITNKTLPLAEELSGAYMSWNVAIAEAFFGAHNQDRAVYLSPENHILDQIATSLGVTVDSEESLYDVVRDNLDLEAGPSGIYARFDRAIGNWKTQSPNETPPHIALLAFFSRIALRMHTDENYFATNYTARYTTALGLTVDSLEGERAKQAYGRIAQQYFQHLNKWLDDHDGRLGVATGYAMDSRIHVGLAIAQSLVPDPDRKKLSNLFSHHDLRPGETMSISDMERLLSSWVISSNVSNLLKRLWRRSPLVKKQIASIAVQELAVWPGVVKQDVAKGHIHQRRIRLTASMGGFSNRSLRLGLVVPAGLDLAGNHLTPTNDVHKTASIILSSVGGSLEIASQSLGGQSEVINSAGLDFEAILQVKFSLESQGLDGSIEWRPDPMLILRRDPAVPGRYIQQRRVDLGSQLMVLVVDKLALDVSEYLAQVARPGFKSYSSSQIAGCPAGWTLFDRVLITDVADPSNEELLPLSPETQRTRIAFEGGLRISGGNRSIWHSSDPPEVTISAHNASSAAFSVIFTASGDGNSEQQEIISRNQFAGSTSFKLPSQSSAGTIVVNLYEPENTKQPEQRTITIVNGASPRPHPSTSADFIIGREMGKTGTLLNGRIEIPSKFPYIVGAKPVGLSPVLSGEDGIFPSDTGFDVDDIESPDDQESHVVKTVRLESSQIVSCFIGENHHFILPDVDNTQGSGKSNRPSEFTIQPCKNCGRIKSHHQWPAHWKSQTSVNSVTSTELTPLLTPDKKPIIEWQPADPDQLLDALTYLGAGNWGSLQRLALQVNQDPNYPRDLARSLSSMGHIELEVDDNWSITDWTLAPRCLVMASSGTEAFLTGSRSVNDLEWLESLAEDSGTAVFTSKSELRLPSRVGLMNLDSDAINRLKKSGGDHFFEDLPMKIALNSLPLAQALSQLPSQDTSAGVSANKFDPQTLKWKEGVYRSGEEGAYQFGSFRKWYAYDDGESLRRAEYQVVKHLSAKSEGRPLISYENKLSELRAPLGAELPGLYDRAATLCSGIPASKHSASPWVVVYRDISENLAATIFNKIYG